LEKINFISARKINGIVFMKLNECQCYKVVKPYPENNPLFFQGDMIIFKGQVQSDGQTEGGHMGDFPPYANNLYFIRCSDSKLICIDCDSGKPSIEGMDTRANAVAKKLLAVHLHITPISIPFRLIDALRKYWGNWTFMVMEDFSVGKFHFEKHDMIEANGCRIDPENKKVFLKLNYNENNIELPVDFSDEKSLEFPVPFPDGKHEYAKAVTFGELAWLLAYKET
jgi:hypothetical protein